jgi:enoyl-CoA hydratase
MLDIGLSLNSVFYLPEEAMSTPNFETLAVEINNHVATVELARPKKANAMSVTMWVELQQCFEWIDLESDIRVVILSGQGKNFCAGIDLGMFGNLTDDGMEPARKAEQLRLTIKRLQANLTAIEQCRKPVLAAIHGASVGGAIDMITCCDMRYCTEDAYFSIKEIDIGMVADVGTLQRLPKLVGDGIVRELAYTGRTFFGAEAVSMGLANKVYADKEQMMAGVQAIAAEIATKSPLSIRGTKEMMRYTRDHSVEDSLNYIATWNAGMLSAADLMIGISGETNFED